MTLDEQIENIWELIDLSRKQKTLDIYLSMLRSKVKKKKATVGAAALQANM